MTHFDEDLEPFSLAIVIPNRNDSKYLPLCIQSIVSQTVRPDELIIIDDESTDNSIEVIRAEIRDYSFARLELNPKNLGGVQTANLGLRLARSKFVLFLGANDLMLPGLLERVKACLKNFPHAGLWSAMVWLMDEEDHFLKMHPSPVVALHDAYFKPERCRRMMCVLGNWLTGQTTVYRREALLEAGGFDPSLKALNDLLTAHVVASRYGAAFSPLPAGVMRIHKGAFLTETLRDPCVLDQILSNIRLRGPKIEPKLFTKKMLNRTVARFYFASLRLSGGETIGHIRNRTDWLRRFALRLAGAVPQAFPGIRTALFFSIMRPFDIVPAIWYRILGSKLVLFREFIRGRIPR